MTIPLIAEEDLESLIIAFPKLDFTDPECRAVLLASGSVDIQAAPGSGKTTILAAKLYLLSRKWASDRHGICVISHTNTAANEIRRRLASTSEGVRLLAYPHFIGTIHGFVNQFLSLPRLRSDGGTIDVIDDEVFAKLAQSRARANGTTRAWADYQSNGNELIGQMRFLGPDLEIVSGKNFPSPASPSGRHLRKIKKDLAVEGVFRHIDMFAFAERAIAVAPRLAQLLARRFPLVMIDEMQDTSASQKALLAKAFEGGSVIQRFGDINQRIFFSDDEGEDENQAPFPEEPQLPMSTSRRFGQTIASLVSKVQEKGAAVIGKGPDLAAPLTLLVYTAQTLDRVIPRFGELVLDALDDESITNGGHIRAICARRGGESKEAPGRHIGDFWPPLAMHANTAAPKATSAWRLLAEHAGMGHMPVELAGRSENMRRIVLLALREAKAPIADDVREPWRLFRAMRELQVDLRPLRRAMRDVVMNKDSGSTEILRVETIRRLYRELSPFMPGTTLEDFTVLPVFADPKGDDDASVSKSLLRTCTVEASGRSVNVTVDTVGNTKGETQLATLYLESIGRYSKRFDVVEAIARQTGRKTVKGKPLKTLPSQMRHAYVGFSRPTRFLCLAVNSERLNAEDRKTLIDNGWRVENLG
ncbi:UvrD-helicase domain-containing protein [Stenotrophomonas sp. AR029]|uniref:UvrD-helicase domain-containing protein n=1 Tax=Stenotrophomonas sp. AR029 TaxID=3398601 RepID=UPI0039C60340